MNHPAGELYQFGRSVEPDDSPLALSRPYPANCRAFWRAKFGACVGECTPSKWAWLDRRPMPVGSTEEALQSRLGLSRMWNVCCSFMPTVEIPTHRLRKEQSMIRPFILLSLAVAALSISSPSCADVVPIDPFGVAMSENFDRFSQGGRLQQLVIFDGFATVRNLTPDGAIKVEYYSSRGGIVVMPHSRPLMMGQMGVMEWEFEEPLSQFGSYFANDSRVD